MWVNITSLEQYKELPDTAETLDFDDDEVTSIVLGFDYNWFGETVTEVCLSSNGQINMGETCDNSWMSKSIGSYDGKRIAFVQTDLYPPGGGTVQYFVNSSPASLKVSFEDVKFYDGDEGGIGSVQSQVELFANGDIIFCYGEGEMVYGDSFAAGVEDSRCHVAYPIPDAPFNGEGITYAWPLNTCWKFHMPAECPSMAPSLSSKPTVSFNVTII